MDKEKQTQNSEQLEPTMLNALRKLTTPTGGFEGKSMILRQPDLIENNPRHLDIPASYEIPTSPVTNNEITNYLNTIQYSTLDDGEAAFNPVLEFEKYLELHSKGLVEMEAIQGSKMVRVSINEKGAGKLGKILIKKEPS